MAATIVSPFSVSLSADGTANLQVNETGTYQFVGNADMDLNCSVSMAGLVSAFLIANPTSDNVADFAVTRDGDGADAFKAFVSGAINAGLTAAAGDSNANSYSAAPINSSAKVYLLNQAQKDLDADLEATDGIAATLSAEQMKEVAISDGAWETATNGAGANAWSNLTGAHGNIIARQLSPTRYSDTTEETRIPLLAGDVFKFRVTCAQNYTISTQTKSDLPNGMTSATYEMVKSQNYYTVKNKVLQFNVTLS
jgi:hypothetical protein